MPTGLIPFPSGPARAARALLKRWTDQLQRNDRNLVRVAAGAPILPPLEAPMTLPLPTPRPAAPPPVLTPAETAAVGAWLRRHAFAGSPRLEAALVDLAALDAADAQARERLRATGAVEVLREEVRAVGAAYAAGSASAAAVADAVRRLREREAAQAEAVAALAEIERQRAAVGAVLAQEARDAVRRPAAEARARLRAAVERVVEATAGASEAHEHLAALVTELEGPWDAIETPWLPPIGQGGTKLRLPRSGVREVAALVRDDLRPRASGRHAEWVRETQAVRTGLARLDEEGGR